MVSQIMNFGKRLVVIVVALMAVLLFVYKSELASWESRGGVTIF